MSKHRITVMSPLLPPKDELGILLDEIWESRIITNQGIFHDTLESKLSSYLKVPALSLMTNGTSALICAIRSLGITGEIITTPYSFAATAHAIHWCGLKPVFVDIDPNTCNIDPNKIEAAITSKTSAILPVHVYGQPCDTEQIEKIARNYGLKVIYDAAHAFGVEERGESILNRGDISIVSFHATKVYNTIEGGAIICKDKMLRKQIEYLRNFGFEDEISIVMPGINAKMDELRSAYGLVNLRYVSQAIEKRRELANRYRELLTDMPGLSLMRELPDVKYNYAYFPVFIDAGSFGMTRDQLYTLLTKSGILCRRYFYPLISSFNLYNLELSARTTNLTVAAFKAESVLCLPLHQELTFDDIEYIIRTIKEEI